MANESSSDPEKTMTSEDWGVLASLAEDAMNASTFSRNQDMYARLYAKCQLRHEKALKGICVP